MVEALWSVEFVSNVQGQGAGVVVLETGRIFGGDSNYFYLGSYEVADGVIRAEVTARHYAGPPSSVLGNSEVVTVAAAGRIGHDFFAVDGHLVGDPSRRISIRLTRRAELP